MNRRRKLLIGLGCLLLVASAVMVWVVKSGTINRYVVERAQAEIERAIGAKLEVGKLHINVWQGRAVAEGVVLHCWCQRIVLSESRGRRSIAQEVIGLEHA